ncbi:MAG TPA: arsenosugar biosynthesis radical SAM (seleno)protein ArsS, partial [bacterium]|nr:arsenosugar biosynthesis radical SAM (seleno)protein ArsS [bacterium]
CKHCHVDAGPDREEVMSRETLQACLDVLRRHSFPTVDITGGAPELNPHFRWFVERAAPLCPHVIVRSNLTIITTNKRHQDLPRFFREHRLHVISSLPYYESSFTDRQRGQGVFERSITALKLLNAEGYGQPGSGLELDLVYNPAGAFLPAPQASLEADYRRELAARHGIVFNRLYTLTNLPISRFLEYLEASGNLEDYLERLVNAFNPAAALGVMCRNTLSIGWDGALYDCDFNQMLELGLAPGQPRTIHDFNLDLLRQRPIQVGQHCYGCTAGAGSSCTGTIA